MSALGTPKDSKKAAVQPQRDGALITLSHNTFCSSEASHPSPQQRGPLPVADICVERAGETLCGSAILSPSRSAIPDAGHLFMYDLGAVHPNIQKSICMYTVLCALCANLLQLFGRVWTCTPASPPHSPPSLKPHHEPHCPVPLSAQCFQTSQKPQQPHSPYPQHPWH